MAEEITAEEIAQHFSAMDDSVGLIADVVADDSEALKTMDAAEVKEMVTRNTDHLELQAGKDWYKASDKSKTAYDNAVTAGKAYVAG